MNFTSFALRHEQKDLMSTKGKIRPSKWCKCLMWSGTTGLVFVAVGHYWIGFGEGQIWIGFEGPGKLLDWIHFERNATGLG